MPITAMISLALTAAMLLLSLLFKAAGKLRLTIPLIYFLLVATVLNKWAASHETLAFAILYLLVSLSILSWIRSLRSKWKERKYYKALEEDMTWQAKRARELGIPLDTVYFDSQGNMRYKDTDEIVIG